MSTSVEMFIDGLPLDGVRGRIRECTGLAGEIDDHGNVAFLQPDFAAFLKRHSYVDDDELDFTSYEYELSAKNRWRPEDGGPLESPTVRWFHELFEGLRTHNDLRLLLTYNLETPLDRFEPAQ